MVAQLVAAELFARSWFFETREGNCRLMGPFAAKLSDTALTWRKFIAPWAEYIARELWFTTKKRASSQDLRPTRLTQNKKRAAKGHPAQVATIPKSRRERLCRKCGKVLSAGGEHLCASCMKPKLAEGMVVVAKKGRLTSHTIEAKAFRSATQQRHWSARKEWMRSGGTSISEEVYKSQIQPNLMGMTVISIQTALQVSIVYASHIRRGMRTPHPRHWQALFNLVSSAPI